MATKKGRVTCTLSPNALRVLETAAARWGVSKSEALTRAIEAIELNDVAHRLVLLASLQAAASVNGSEANRRAAAVRAERRAQRR